MGLFSGIARGLGKVVGKVIKTGLPAVPGGGLIKTGISIGTGIVKKAVRRNAKKIIAAGVVAGTGAVITGGFRGGGGGGEIMGPAGPGGAAFAPMGGFGRRRRMNAGNAKALRRAVRRVEAGARLFSKFYGMKTGRIKGAAGVKVKHMVIGRRRAA